TGRAFGVHLRGESQQPRRMGAAMQMRESPLRVRFTAFACIILLSAANTLWADDPQQGSLQYLDSKYGFRGLAFGSPPPKDMKVVEDHGDIKYCQRPGEDLSIGGGRASRIVYGFYKNRFYWLLIETKALSDSRAVLDVLKQAYGSGHRPNQFLDEYYWFG